MQKINIICVGKLKEKFYTDAAEEYRKRLSRSCSLIIDELPESRLPPEPSPGDISRALEAESKLIASRLPKAGAVVAMCVEGKEMTSEKLAETLSRMASGGLSQVTFIIGGSFGLSDNIKSIADIRLSMSPMTFPHHMARVMLLEQIYRSFQILEGTKYHK